METTVSEPKTSDQRSASLVQKMFCLHKWGKHAQTEEHHSSPMQQGTVILEVLICRDCGKIKIIQY